MDHFTVDIFQLVDLFFVDFISQILGDTYSNSSSQYFTISRIRRFDEILES